MPECPQCKSVNAFFTGDTLRCLQCDYHLEVPNDDLEAMCVKLAFLEEQVHKVQPTWDNRQQYQVDQQAGWTRYHENRINELENKLNEHISVPSKKRSRY